MFKGTKGHGFRSLSNITLFYVVFFCMKAMELPIVFCPEAKVESGISGNKGILLESVNKPLSQKKFPTPENRPPIAKMVIFFVIYTQ